MAEITLWAKSVETRVDREDLTACQKKLGVQHETAVQLAIAAFRRSAVPGDAGDPFLEWRCDSGGLVIKFTWLTPALRAAKDLAGAFERTAHVLSEANRSWLNLADAYRKVSAQRRERR